MLWPTSQDYNEAVQNPQTSFGDSELRQGQVITNALGIPQPCSGNFADVYAIECPATRSKWAVKCFTREVYGLCDRYSEISNYLRQVRLPFTVDFQYFEQGIRIAGRWYPILKMHWVEGATLNLFVRDMLDKPSMLEKLSRIWVRMARRMREVNIAHCDLQHGNILLVPDSGGQALAAKLIDYDGMWVPKLANRSSGEVGHPAYQHPQRLRDGIYNAEVDRFPLLVIYCSLRALKVGGRQLWERFDTGDNLLFRQQDFEAPAKSPLLADLLRMNHPEVRDLAAKIIDGARMPLEQVPHLADLVPDEKPVASAFSHSKPQPASRTTTAVTAEASIFQDIETESTGGGSRHKAARPRSLIPWIAVGSVAACALIAGILLWGLRLGGNSEKPSTLPAVVQARHETARQTPENKVSTAPHENQPAPPKKPSDLPPPKTTKPNAPPFSDKPLKRSDSPSLSPKPSDSPSVPPKPRRDATAILMELEQAKEAYKTALKRAKMPLRRRFEEVITSFAEKGNTKVASQLKEELQLFESHGMLFGRRPELKEAMLEYGEALKSARETLASSYHKAIEECTKLKNPKQATQLKSECDRLALDALLVSLQALARNTYIQHGGYLGWLKRVTSDSDRLNATFEMVPGLADATCVSFRSVNIPDHYLVHGDYRIRLQISDNSDGYRKNGTFKQVKGLGAATAFSFESVNYPGYYIRAKRDALVLEKYDGSPQFRLDATFKIVAPQFQLWRR